MVINICDSYVHSVVLYMNDRVMNGTIALTRHHLQRVLRDIAYLKSVVGQRGRVSGSVIARDS